MAKFWHVILLFGLLLSASVPSVRADDDADVDDDDYADTERAHLIVRKSIKEEFVVVGQNITVVIEIFNAGSSSAFNVELKDGAIPDTARLLNGTLKASFPKINVGGQVAHTYTLVTDKGDAALILPPASVHYKAESDSSDVQDGKSNTPGVYVLTKLQQLQRYALLAGTYASLGMARTPKDWRNMSIFLAVVGGLLGANWMYKAAAEQRTSSRRKKALESLEKDQ